MISQIFPYNQIMFALTSHVNIYFRFVMDKDDKAVDLTRDMLATLLPNYANEVTEASLLAVQIYLHLMDGALASDGDCDINQMGAPLMIWLATFKQVYDRSTVRRSVSYFDYALKIFRTRYETIHDLPEKEIKVWKKTSLIWNTIIASIRIYYGILLLLFIWLGAVKIEHLALECWFQKVNVSLYYT